MKKIRIFHVILTMFLVITVCDLNTTVYAMDLTEFNLRIAQLQQQFRDGEYWHYDDNVSSSIRGESTGKTLLQTTPNKPIHHTGTCDGSCACKCGRYYGAEDITERGQRVGGQCYGYAAMLGKMIFGSNPYGEEWEEHTDLNRLQPGDIVRYTSTGGGHSIFITGVNGDKITFTECNHQGPCLVRWNISTDNDKEKRDKNFLNPKLIHIRHNKRGVVTSGNSITAAVTNTKAVERNTQTSSGSSNAITARFVILSPMSPDVDVYTNKNMPLTGFLLTSKPACYIMGDCPKLPGCQWNLGQYASDLSNSATTRKMMQSYIPGIKDSDFNYLYFFKIDNPFGPYTLSSNTNYTMNFQTGFQDGAQQGLTTITFRTGNLGTQVKSETEKPVNPSSGGRVVIPPADKPALEPYVMHIDAPQNYYDGSNNIEVSGWIASQSDPSYVMLDYGIQQNLTATLKDADDVKSAYDGFYKYNKRFTGVIPLTDLESNRTYECKVIAGFADGSESNVIKSTFRVGQISSYSIVSAVAAEKRKLDSATQIAPYQIVIGKPMGSYNISSGSVSISGWIASNETPDYLMAEYSNGGSGGQLNLSSSLKADSGAGSGINDSDYKNIYKFTGTIPLNKLEDQSSYTFKVWSKLSAGTYAEGTGSFSTGNVTGKKATKMGFDIPVADGTYAGIIDVTGWIASDSPIVYAQYQADDSNGKIIDGVGNLTVYEDQAVINANSGYKYGYRFKKSIGLSAFREGALYTLRAWAGTDAGIRTDISTIFKTAAISSLNCKDYYLHLDAPSGKYSGSNNFEVVGWIGSYAPITYALYQIDEVEGKFGGLQNSLGLEDAPDAAQWLKSIGLNYTYVKRFRGVVEIPRLPSDTSFNLRVWMGLGSSGVTDAWKADAVHSFSTGTVTKPTYTIKFDTGGGSGGPGNVSKTYQASLALPKTIPVKWGYSFKGWTTIRDSSKVEYYPGDTFVKDENTTLYAVWKKAAIIPNVNTYSYYYMGKGGAPYIINGKTGFEYLSFTPHQSGSYSFAIRGGAGSSIEHVYTSKGVELPRHSMNETQLSGTTFYRWDLEANQAYYVAVGSDSWTTGGTSLNSILVSRNRHIVFDAEGGSGEPSDLYYFWNGSTKLPEELPTRKCTVTLDHMDGSGEKTIKTFSLEQKGWRTLDLVDGQYVSTYLPSEQYSSISDEADETMYAFWRYSSVGDLPEPEREGYVFTGWVDSFGREVNENYQITSDAVLYATWEKQEIAIESVALEQDTLSLSVGEEKIMNPVITPEHATDQRILWGVEDASIAWVDTKGIVCGVAPGVTTVNGVTSDGLHSITCQINVGSTTYPVVYTSTVETALPEQQEKEFGKDLVLSSMVPEAAGKEFVGWKARQEDGTDLQYNPGDTYKTDSPLYLLAAWADVNTISFDANGGEGAPEESHVRSDQTFAIPDQIPERLNHEFLGWKDITLNDSAADLYHPGDTLQLSGNTTLQAQWEPAKYTVRFDAAGGSSTIAPQTKLADIDLVLSYEVPVREGYAFKGWASSPQSGTVTYQPGGFYKSNNDITLYAVWDHISVPLSGLRLSDESKTVEITNTFSILAWLEPDNVTDPVILWTTTDESVLKLIPVQGSSNMRRCDIQALSPGTAVVRASNEDGTVYAECEVTVTDKLYTYTFVYPTDNGSHSFTMEKRKGTPAALPEPEGLESDHQIFDYWYYITASGNSSRHFEPGYSMTINDDVKFYGVWHTKTYKLSFDANGGEGSITKEKIHDIDYNMSLSGFSDLPEREGYRLLGWGTTPSSTQPVTVYKDNEDATFYAIWAEDGYDIIYNANGGYNAPKAQIRPYGHPVMLTGEIPSRNGYLFRGWSLSQNASTPLYLPGDIYSTNESHTLYAVWEKQSVTRVSTDISNVELYTGGAYYLISGTETTHCRVEPEEAYNQKLIYSSMDESIATVSSSSSDVWISGKNPGTTTVAVTSEDGGHTSYITVLVKPVSITLQFDANGGTNAPGPITRNRVPTSYGNTSFTLPFHLPERAGYRFLYWTDSQEDGEHYQYYSGRSYEFSQNTTLYARWEEDSSVPVEEVRLTPSGLSLLAGTSGKVSLSVYPENAEEKNVFWESSDEDVVKVDQEGSVLGISPGNALVFARLEGEDVYGICTVNVLQNNYSVEYDVNGGEGAVETQTQPIGTPICLMHDIPIRPGYLFLGWALNKEADSPEYNPGDIFTAAEDSTLYAVWREKTNEVAGIGLSVSQLSIQTGARYTLKAEIEPIDAINDVVTWSSSDTSVASVDEHGVITANSSGTATITAKSAGEFSADCAVRVEDDVPIYEETIKLPESIHIIEEEAFADTSASVFIIPSGAEKISSNAFAGCDNLKLLYIPDSMLVIEDQIFDDTGNVTIVCHPDTIAEKWTIRHNLRLFILK